MIRCKTFDNFKPKTVEDAILLFLAARSPETWADNTLQCSSGRNRSLDDLFRLFKTYFPDLTVEVLVNILNRVIMKLPFPRPYMGYCPDIRRPVLFYNGSYSDDTFEKGVFVRWRPGETFTKTGCSAYSLEDIYDMIDK